MNETTSKGTMKDINGNEIKVGDILETTSKELKEAKKQMGDYLSAHTKTSESGRTSYKSTYNNSIVDRILDRINAERKRLGLDD